MPQVVTELVIDSSGAQQGAAAYSDAMNKASQAANDNLKAIADNTAALRNSMTGLNDNARQASEGTAGYAVELASVANHLRQAGEAAYAFSPAFRSVVNEMAVPALAAAGTALEVVASGMVTGTNLAGTGLIALAGAAEKVAPGMLGLTSYVRSAGVAMEAFAPTIGGIGASILGMVGTIAARFLPIVGQILLVYDAIKLIGEAWTLGGQKLAEYVALSEKATAANVSTDFFQRITKASTDAKVPVDALLAALANLDKATQNQLGTVDSAGNVTQGNSAQARLDALTKAGNFQGNSGVSDLKNATDTESKYRAVLSLISQAVDAGQRLAALDVAKTFLGQPAADAIAKSSSSAKDLLAAADRIDADTLVKQADVDRADALKQKWDAAVAILEQRWHPIQDLLTDQGIKMQAAWVDIVASIASAVDGVTKLVLKIAEIPQTFWDYAKTGIHAAATGVAAVAPALLGPPGVAIGGVAGIVADATATDQTTASGSFLDRLGKFGGTASRTPTNIKDSPLYKDTSHPVPDANSGSSEASAYDRTTASLTKYIETTKAATASVGASASEQERLKAAAELTAAGIKDGLTPAAAAAKAQLDGITVSAGAAADALAKAKVAGQIDFGQKTAMLSQEDVQIATQLKGIYGNDIPAALNSTYAAQIRVNDAMKQVSSSIETNLTSGLTDIVSGTKSVSQGFHDMAASILKDIEQMVIKFAIVQPLMQSFGLGGLGSLFGGATGGAGVSLGSASSPLAGLTAADYETGLGVYAGGGYTGPGAVDQPKGVVHAGEVVWSQADVSRAGGVSVVEAMRQGQRGYADGGPVMSSNVIPFRPQSGGSVVQHFAAPQIVIQGNADDKAIAQIKQVLNQHQNAIAAQGRAMQSARHYQMTGVG